MSQLRDKVPNSILFAIDDYVEKRLKPGSFTYKMLCNQPFAAIGHAHPTTQRALYDIMLYIKFEVPRDKWGNKEKVDAWLDGRT